VLVFADLADGLPLDAASSVSGSHHPTSGVGLGSGVRGEAG
jgi:hypothetical protein